MRNVNNKGFTLIEVLAVIVIIGILSLIAVPSVFSIINNGKNSSYDILVKDITIAAIGLHEEVSFVGTNLYYYDINGNTGNIIQASDKITINLQTLVSNGFLNGVNNLDENDSNNNLKIITNPKTKDDIGECEIEIIKVVDDDTFQTSYIIENISDDEFCPTNDDYKGALNIK